MTTPTQEQAVVDLEALGAWMDDHGLERGPIADMQPLTGGTQNVMVRFARGEREFVLRRGPRHLRRASNDAIRREMRVLTALAGTDVPHPRLVASCADEQVLAGAAFYLMEPVRGFNPTVALPDELRRDPTALRAMGLAAAAALAALGAVDHEAVGLSDFGRPEGFLERQVPRWMGELESYGRLEGYPGPDIPGLDDVAAWLERHRPASFRPGILHGDFHFANLMFAPDGTQVAAIVDWEMSTIGDPLLDLGWLLATWPTTAGPFADLLGPAGGLPTPAEVVARYAERSERDLTGVQWYVVLACFKLGIVLEGTYARSCAGQAPRETGERLRALTLTLFERATATIAEGWRE